MTNEEADTAVKLAKQEATERADIHAKGVIAAATALRKATEALGWLYASGVVLTLNLEWGDDPVWCGIFPHKIQAENWCREAEKSNRGCPGSYTIVTYQPDVTDFVRY
jgi:hypothetical protein